MQINPPKDTYDIHLFDDTNDTYVIGNCSAERVTVVEALHAVIQAAGDRPTLALPFRTIVQECCPEWNSYDLSVFIADALRKPCSR